MYLLICFGLVLTAAVMGLGLLLLLPSSLRREPAHRRLFLAPAAGATVAAMLVYWTVVLANGLTWFSAVPVAVLIALGAYSLGRHWRAEVRPSLIPFVLSAAALTVLVALPFRNHLAPPDVDAQLFGFLSSLMKGSFGFPMSTMWPGLDAERYFVATAGSDALTAGVSAVLGLDLARSLIVVAMLWVVSTLLAAVPLAQAIVGDRSPLLLAAIVPLTMNAAFIWEYGDGAYARAAAAAPTMLIAALLAMPSGFRSQGSYALIGIVHGATVYLLYRVFLWNSLVLAAWAIIEIVRARAKPAGQLRLMLWAPVAGAVCVAPLAFWVASHASAYGAAHGSAADLFREKHELSNAFLWANALRFHGLLVPLVALSGCAIVAIKAMQAPTWLRWEAIRVGAAFLAATLFFSIDRLVLFVLPFTYGVLYSQMAVISNWAVPKLVFGAVAICALYDFLQRATVSKRISIALLTLAGVLALLASIGSDALVRLAAFARDLPDISGTEIAYAVLALAAATVIGLACLVTVRTAKLPALLCLCAILGMTAHELLTSKFNYSYLEREEREAYLWLRDNTAQAGTIVLTPATVELTPERRAQNARRYFPDSVPPPVYSLHWLPVVSERAAIFHRGTMTMQLTGMFLPIRGGNPDFEQLDWAFWNLDRPQARAVARTYRVSHVYVPALFGRMMAADLAANPGLELVHESAIVAAFSAPNRIYRLRQEDERTVARTPYERFPRSWPGGSGGRLSRTHSNGASS
jgi:hypothetical protein